MSEILKKQKQFGRMLPRLLDYIHDCGYDYTLGWLQRSIEDAERFGFKGSLHVIKLAVDIAIFDKNNKEKPLTKTEDYAFAGQYWEGLGGTWGGRIPAPNQDGNHFSVSYQGKI